MPRKTYEIPGFVIELPVESLWENERHSWEGDLGDDPMGNDIEGRLWALNVAIKAGHAPPDASKALIERSQIEELVQPLGLTDIGPLVKRLWAIAGRHLRPTHMEILGSDPKATTEVLDDVRRGVIKLEAALDRLPLVVREFLTSAFLRLPRHYRNNEKLDIEALERALPDLGHIVFLLGDVLKRKRKRPPNILRRQTLLDAARTIEQATAQSIRTRWSEDGRACFKFQGVEGAVLLQFMKMVEPSVSEQALVKDFRMIGRGRTMAPPPKK